MTDILMSTYNGARFLAAQLDSILAQDHPDIRLIIRDDGSTDSTIEIVESYIARDARISFLRDDLGNLGPARSFLSLIEKSTAPLFMLADQDDIWFSDKVSHTLTRMQSLVDKHGNDIPLAVFTDLTVVNEQLEVIDKSFWHYQKLDPVTARSWRQVLAQNVVTGCTLMVNSAAKSVLLPFSLPEMMHDHWIAANVAKHGRLDFITEPTVFYRQHSQNAEGANSFGAGYAAAKLPGISERFAFYQRAAAVFGDISALGLMYRKLALNIKRLI